jgi:TPR repeat protein
MMVNGRGGPVDVPGALHLFEKAADEGHVGAMFALGALHGGGHQIPTDRKIAQRWLRSAAEEGHGYAQLMLGRYLAAGANGEPQPEEARDWFARALAQGIIEAEDDLAALPPDADSDEESDQDMPAARV